MIELIVGVVGVLPVSICAREHVARAALVEQLPVWPRPACIRSRVLFDRDREQKDAGNALDLFDRAVDPRPAHSPGEAVDVKMRFTVVESAEDQVGPAELAGAEVP